MSSHARLPLVRSLSFILLLAAVALCAGCSDDSTTGPAGTAPPTH